MQNPLPYLLLFTESVRGLNPDAPVEFRGIRIGTVEGVSFRYLPNDPERRVPVHDPDRSRLSSPNCRQRLRRGACNSSRDNVAKGLRASLKSGNLLTGQMFIDLDFQKDAKPAEVRGD